MLLKKTIPALGHKWDEGKVTTEPTATSAGVKTFTCIVCGNTKAEGIPMLPDDSKKDETQPSTDKKDETTSSTNKKQDTTTVVNSTKPVAKKDVAKVGTKFVVAGQAYKVTKSGKEVSFIAAKKNAKNISVPATVKNKGVTYKVTSIAAKAVKSNKKVKAVNKKIVVKVPKKVKKTYGKVFKGMNIK